MDWLYINPEQRKKLQIAYDLIEQVRNEINSCNREFSLINTSLFSLEDAIEMENIKKPYKNPS